jgi:hypothetical protein
MWNEMGAIDPASRALEENYKKLRRQSKVRARRADASGLPPNAVTSSTTQRSDVRPTEQQRQRQHVQHFTAPMPCKLTAQMSHEAQRL